MKLDNQQERQFFNIGFLVGMIEGEGSISLLKTVRPTKFHAYISITGMNKILMEYTAETAKNLGLPFHFKRYGYNKVYRIQVYGMSRCKKWLDIIFPYLTGKKPQAEILLEFIALREKVIKLHPSQKPYSEKEYELKEKLKQLNANRTRTESPETIR